MGVISQGEPANAPLEAGAFSPGQVHPQRPAWTAPGVPAAIAALAVFAVAVALIAVGAAGGNHALLVIGIVVAVVLVLARSGFIVVQPNESRVLIVLGR